jgi:hypothetical protein
MTTGRLMTASSFHSPDDEREHLVPAAEIQFIAEYVNLNFSRLTEALSPSYYMVSNAVVTKAP